jgi:hypothetical protein
MAELDRSAVRMLFAAHCWQMRGAEQRAPIILARI